MLKHACFSLAESKYWNQKVNVQFSALPVRQVIVYSEKVISDFIFKKLREKYHFLLIEQWRLIANVDISSYQKALKNDSITESF